MQKRIADIITTQILPNPQSFIELGTKYVDGKNVIEIKVKKGNALYYIKKYGRSAAGCFIRIGTTCRSMTEEEIERRYIESLSIPEKAIKDIPVLRDDLTFAKLKQYLINKGIPKNLTKEEFLSGKTEPVNKELMKIFLQCGIVVHSGHGVPIVVKEYGERAYSFSQNMITVTLNKKTKQV